DLWVLPSGFTPPNPSEMLGSQHMAALLDELKDRFDIVIVDCPPLLPVTDGAIMAARADGALLVTRARKTTSAEVGAAVQALQSVDAHLLGCVLNMAPATGPDAYYYYDGYAEQRQRRSGWARLARALSFKRDDKATAAAAGADDQSLDLLFGTDQPPAGSSVYDVRSGELVATAAPAGERTGRVTSIDDEVPVNGGRPVGQPR
ncbi:MAG TPA: CpsD/CapB family tyrosine-protein kinase, partial [Actinoplanes sp.]|nr:CpsD/CapB family tyrosine-protein kinase [Actinoplanes sp.]